MTQTQLLNKHDFHLPEEEFHGSGKSKAKAKPKPKAKAKPEPKKKLIDTYTKIDLEKIAKKHDVSLKSRDGKVKTKEQLFNSLKRKKLI